MNIDIITAVTRPWNLNALAHSIEVANADVQADIEWWLVGDMSYMTPQNTIRCNITNIHEASYKGYTGPMRKNLALNAIGEMGRDTMIYVLDDDNITHPDLLNQLASCLKTYGRPVFVTGQARWDGGHKHYLFPNPPFKFGEIDTAMYVVHSRLAYGVSYPSITCGSDYGYISALWRQFEKHFVISEKIGSFFNYLDVASDPGRYIERE